MSLNLTTRRADEIIEPIVKEFFGKAQTIALAILLLGASFALGIFVGTRAPSASLPQNVLNTDVGMSTLVDFSPFWKVWSVLNEKYVAVSTSTDMVTDQDKVWGAIVGLTESFGDPYTVFFPPVEAEIFQSEINGNFTGVGMEIGIRDGILTVVAPLKESPAARAGILPQDKILAIDGKSTAKVSVEEAVSKIRGPEGSKVVLTMYREGKKEPFDITIVRAVIDLPTLETEMRSDGIFVIRLFSFSAPSPNLFRNALREFISSGSTRLILDLRDNPGGYLEAAVDMASWFLPTGKVIAVEDFGGNKEPEEYRSKGYDIFNKNLKLVILVNKGSASASEILAGALKEHGLATLVGEQTFGKGSVQELVSIADGTSLKVTIARWLTPNGISISLNGLTPDVVVAITAEDIQKRRDSQMVKAVEILLKK